MEFVRPVDDDGGRRRLYVHVDCNTCVEDYEKNDAVEDNVNALALKPNDYNILKCIRAK